MGIGSWSSRPLCGDTCELRRARSSPDISFAILIYARLISCREEQDSAVEVTGLNVFGLYSCRVRTSTDSADSDWLVLDDVRTSEGRASPPQSLKISAQVIR